MRQTSTSAPSSSKPAPPLFPFVGIRPRRADTQLTNRNNQHVRPLLHRWCEWRMSTETALALVAACRNPTSLPGDQRTHCYDLCCRPAHARSNAPTVCRRYVERFSCARCAGGLRNARGVEFPSRNRSISRCCPCDRENAADFANRFALVGSDPSRAAGDRVVALDSAHHGATDVRLPFTPPGYASFFAA